MRTLLYPGLLGALLAGACSGARRPQAAGPAEAGSPQVAGPEVASERAHHDHGHVDFPVSCNAAARQQMEAGLAQLHHMMYEQAVDDFQAALGADQSCAMGHWGIAMASFQPLWHPTTDAGLQEGMAAIARARELGAPTERERDYVAAAAAYFEDPKPPADSRPQDHQRRLEAWLEAQRRLHEKYPADVDAAAFYALSEVALAMAEASPAQQPDRTRERRAGAVLERYLERHPQHPGLFHYLIHAYDSPELAPRAEPIARRYDQLAPEVPHALHMPSHIFVRTGQWQETARWNERSAEAALRHPVEDQTSLHYPHALDYMMYAYLQLGEEEKARRTLERVQAIENVQDTLAAAYGIAAPQARYYLERQQWAEAAQLRPRFPAALDWDGHPAAEALFYFARGLGAARSGNPSQADAERVRMMALVERMRGAGDAYWASMTEALARAVEGWTLQARGETDRATALLEEAARQEDSMDKHPITPGEVLPVRELYGELLLLQGRPEEAQAAFNQSLQRTPNRRNALIGVRSATQAARGSAPNQ